MSGGSNSGGIAGERLRSIVDRIKRLEEERKQLADDVKDILREAASAGFDPKVVRRVVRDEMKTSAQLAAQEEAQTLYEIYRAALGTLGETPLGAAALKRLTPKSAPPAPVPPSGAEDAPAEAAAPAAAPAQPAAEDLVRAKAEGAAAQKLGKPVLANPYPPLSAMRAAWDQGWCGSCGSDGMDIPDAFRRPKKPGGGEGKGEAGSGGAA